MMSVSTHQWYCNFWCLLRDYRNIKNNFWYIKMISASPHNLYCSWLSHIREDKWSPAQSNFLLGLKFSHFSIFFMIYTFPTKVLGLWIKIEKYEILYWYVCTQYLHKKIQEQKTMRDKIKKNTSIMITVDQFFPD